MKYTSLSRVSAIMVALILASWLHSHAAPLASIHPLGSTMRDRFITNDCRVIISIEYTNFSGGLDTCIPARTDARRFNSYAQFVSYVQLESMRTFNQLNLKNGPPTFHYRLWTTYGANLPGLSIDTWMDTASITQANRFTIDPQIPPLEVSVPGAVAASVQVGNAPIATVPFSGTGALIFDGSYATNNGRSRVTITFADGSIARYTQDGILITPPEVSLHYIPPSPVMPGTWSRNTPHDYRHYYPVSSQEWEAWMVRMNDWYSQYGWIYEYTHVQPQLGSYHARVSATKGADTVLESSVDLSNWIMVDAVLWNSGISMFVAPVSTNGPLEFFRARSY